MKKVITPHKGGRTARLYARITPANKLIFIQEVERRGLSSMADLLERIAKEIQEKRTS